jgi:hypothetical protein
MRKIVGTAVQSVVLVVAGVALFDVPAAYVVSRGASPWLALAVGLAAFPIVALIWHVVRERARRRARPESPKTKGWERLLLRCVAVGVLVIGALLVVGGRQRVWRAVRYHALWFLPDHAGPLATDSPLFDHVPTDAEAMLWVRLSDEAHAELGRALAPIGEASRAIAASDYLVAKGEHGFLVAERGDSAIIDLVEQLSVRLAGFSPDAEHDAFSTTRGAAPDGVHYLVSKEWAATSSAPRAPLFELAPRVPADADIVVLARPRAPVEDTDLANLTTAVGYARVSHGELELVLALEFVTGADARRTRTKIDEGIATLSSDSDTARALRCWQPYGRSDVSTTGARIELSAHIALDDLATVVACVVKD